MKAVVVHKPHDLELVEIPRPTPGPFQALVRIMTCGICGTDRSILAGTFPSKQYPCLLGHESIGRVEEVGPEVRSLAPGDYVLRPYCLSPTERLGELRSQWGGFAEWGLVWDLEAVRSAKPETGPPASTPFATKHQKVPRDFDPVDGAMFITFKECFSFLERAGQVADRNVVVLGSGPVATTFIQAAKVLGARSIAAVGRRPEALELCARVGADRVIDMRSEDVVQAVRDWSGRSGADLVVESTGAKEMLELGPLLLARGGLVALYGVGSATSINLPIGWDRVPNDFSLVRLNPVEEEVHDRCLAAVNAGHVDLKAPLTHVLPLEEIGNAFELLDRREAVKVVIDLDRS